MKTQLLAFIHTLGLYDYLLFGGIIFFFLFFLILAILLRHKLGLAITLVLFAFILLIAAPFGGYIALHSFFYKHDINLTTVRDLEFTEALLIKGDLNNTSQQSFKECKLFFGVSQVSSFQPLNKVYPYFPFRKHTLIIHGPLDPGEGKSFKLLIEPFHYTKKHTVNVWGQCR